MQAIAAFTGSATPRFVDIAEPTAPGPGEVLCRTLELGICGTDREILHGRAPLVPPGSDHLILGHECLARVIAVGADVTQFAAGDLVVPTVRRSGPFTWIRPDMQTFGTFTERGIMFLHGFSAPYWTEAQEHLLPIEPSLQTVAVLTEPLSVAEKGINEAVLLQAARLGNHVWLNEKPRVLVTGLGPIAFAAVLGAIARGWPVTVCGRDEPTSFRAELAQRFGANYIADDRMDWPHRDAEANGFDLILECTGNDGVMCRAALVLASRGIMVWLGGSPHTGPQQHDLGKLMFLGLLRNHLFIGSVNSAPRDFNSALDHLRQLQQSHGSILRQLITARVKPTDALPHYAQRTAQGIKTLVIYQA